MGDKTLNDAFQSFQATLNEAAQNKKIIKPYLQEFYNIKHFTQSDPNDMVCTRVFNALVDATNERKKLPRFLIVMIDQDIINSIDVFDEDAVFMIRDQVLWLARQINIFIRRKRVEITEKCPGAVYGSDPTIIFIRMINRSDHIRFKKNSRKEALFALRAKFNDVLNEAAAQIDQRILTINSCNTRSHFDHRGNLSDKGKSSLWTEIDDLMYRFDKNGIKLLPCPINNKFKKAKKSHSKPNHMHY